MTSSPQLFVSKNALVEVREEWLGHLAEQVYASNMLLNVKSHKDISGI